MDKEDLAAALTTTADQASSWADVAAGLRRSLEEDQSDDLTRLLWAFDYGLDSWRHGSLTGKDPFVPMLGYNDGSSYPPTLEAIEEEALAIWELVADVDGPVVASRLHDLLWERRHGDSPHLHARAAWSAYAELASGEWEAIYRSVCLVRALRLARSLNDSDLVAGTVRSSVDFIRKELAQEGALPGAAFHVLGALVDLPRRAQPGELSGLLQLAGELFADDASLAESISQMKMAHAESDDEVARLQIDLVQRWLQAADSDKGLGRFAHLRHALELAEAYQLTDFARDIRRRIQDSPADEDDFHEVSVELKIPREQLDRYVGDLIGDDSWRQALIRIGGMPPPSGDHATNLDLVEQQRAEHPLMFLVTKVVYGPHGFPVQEVKDQDLHIQVALSEYERLGMELAGGLIGEALDGIKERYGEPTIKDLTDFFTAAFIPEATAERIASSLLHYWNGSLDECVHVLCPRIEASLRIGFMLAGMTVISLPVGGRPGGVRVLGKLMREALARDLMRDVSRTRYLYNLLCDPYGMNLRNAIAHGFLTRARREDAALLIQAVCYLKLLDIARAPEDGSNLDEGVVGAS